MTTATRSGIFWTSIAALIFVTVSAVPAAAQTTKTAGAPTVATAELKGQVVQVEGSDLVVKLASGEIRTFRVPPSRRFIIDGKELTVHDLKPGTTLTATTTTTTTPVSVRTKSIRTATVWYVTPPNVILTLPNGENKQYVVKDDVKFTVNGQPATVFDLRKGMKVAVEKIVEEPTVEIAENISVIGHAPAADSGAPKPAASSAPPSHSLPVSSSVPTASSGTAAGTPPPAASSAPASSAPAASGGAPASSAPAATSTPPEGGGAAAASTNPAPASGAAQAAETQVESGTSPMLWVGLIIVVGIIAAFFFRSKAKG